MSGTEHLLTEVVGHTLVVTMNRPEAKNALSPAMIVGLADAWVRLNDDDDIRCAILTGSGGSFCTGMDLKARANDDSGPNPYQERWAADPDLHWKALLRHYRIRKPLIAAVNGLAFGQVADDLGALLGAALFQDGAAGNDDVAPAAVHLEDLELLGLAHQWANVAHRSDIDLAARQERHGAGEIDGEAAFDAAEDEAGHAFLSGERLLENGPGFFAARLVARQQQAARIAAGIGLAQHFQERDDVLVVADDAVEFFQQQLQQLLP